MSKKTHSSTECKSVSQKYYATNKLQLSDEAILEFVKIFQGGIIECKDVTNDFRNLELKLDEETHKLIPMKKSVR